MEVHRGFDRLPVFRQTAVAVGSFDGVHRGHRLLIDRLNAIAHHELEAGSESVVVTFDPHPRLVLRGSNRLLSTLDERLDLLSETGIDHVVVVRFTPEFSRIDSETFTRDYLQGRLRAVAVLSGDDHHFGRDRSGSTGALSRSGLQTARLGRYENISSTAVRAAVEAGEMETAAALLGGPYLIRTDPPHDPTKLLPPVGEYRVLLPDEDNREVRLTVDRSLFLRDDRPRRLRILGK